MIAAVLAPLVEMSQGFAQQLVAEYTVRHARSSNPGSLQVHCGTYDTILDRSYDAIYIIGRPDAHVGERALAMTCMAVNRHRLPAGGDYELVKANPR